MKKAIVVLIAALALTGIAVAQSAPPAADGQALDVKKIVKLSGKLEVINGMIGIKDGGTSYVVPRLKELVGFVKELQEGASVKLEGYTFPIPPRVSAQANFSILMVTKLSIAGKDYDFSPMFKGGMRGGMRGEGRGGRGRCERCERGERGGRGGMGGGGMWGGPDW